MFRWIFLSIFFYFSLSFGSILEELKSQSKNIGTIKANFTLKIKYKDFDEPDIYKGIMQINKKGQMLIKYTKNYYLTIYLNKNRIKYYNPKTKKVYTKRVKSELVLNMLRTFMKSGDITRFFNLKKEYKLKNGNYKLVFYPKKKYKKEGLNSLVLYLDKNLHIKRAVFFTNDNTLDYQFSNVKYLKKIEKIKFP
jgi:outer membrane lipoprotein-sorting protein